MAKLHSVYMQAENSAGTPVSGAKLYFYVAGTTTPITIYQDSGTTTPHANPVVADASGIFAPIWVATSSYKTVLKTSADVIITTVDNIDGTTASVTEFSDATFRVQDNGDTTKQLAFELSSVTTGTTRTVTVPDYNGTLLMQASGAFSPLTNDGASLGTTSVRWSDVFFASGAVVNWNAGDTTLTHSAGNLALGGSATDVVFDLSAANAGQIKFPATQNSSSDGTTLDDYKESTWTPTILFGGASVGVTYSGQVGTYTKVGRLVIAHANITLTSNGSSTGAVTIGGLPFTNGSQSRGGYVTYYQNLASIAGGLFVDVANGTAVASLFQTGAATVAALTDANITDTAILNVTLIYAV